MKNLEAQKLWESSLLDNYSTPSLHLTHGSGCEVWDVEGNKYLDFLGGIATNLLGHAHPKIVEAISKQAATLSHVSNFYSHPQVVELATKLQKITGAESARVFFCNSGAEANEAAVKLSRLTGKKKILSFEGSFHGRTMGALSITGQREKREAFKPLVPKIKFAEYNNMKSVKRKISKRTAMLIVEPIQGEKGVIPAKKGFLKFLRDITTENETLLAIDAVQTGMGRTGQWFGFEEEGITPDVITLAKGLGGGLPMGAMIAIGKTASLYRPGSHGSTFGGNPIVAACANTTIEVIENENLLNRNLQAGELLKSELSKINGVREVRGSGLLLGIVLTNPLSKELMKSLLEKRILVNSPSDDVIRIAPAYVVSDSQIEEFITTFRKVMYL